MNKTEFLAATKCFTMAWHQTRYKSRPLDEAAKFRLDQRREIGKLARQLFPDGILIHGDNEQGIAETQRLIGDSATKTIFEAAFISGAFTAKVDVLNRSGDGWDVIRVKPSLETSKKVTKDYVDDLAYTVMVLRRAGIAVMRSRLLLLSREYRYGDPVDKLFTFLDKTDNVDAPTEIFEADAEAIADAVLGDQVPEPVLSSACRNCDFRDTVCLGSKHEHTVLELPNLHPAKLQTLSAAGVINITDVPTDLVGTLTRGSRSVPGWARAEPGSSGRRASPRAFPRWRSPARRRSRPSIVRLWPIDPCSIGGGGRTVRPPPVREAWSTGAEVAGASWQTRRPPPAAAVENQAPGPRKRGNHITSSSDLLNRPTATTALPASAYTRQMGRSCVEPNATVVRSCGMLVPGDRRGGEVLVTGGFSSLGGGSGATERGGRWAAPVRASTPPLQTARSTRPSPRKSRSGGRLG